jgi:serine/threonine protein kinase
MGCAPSTAVAAAHKPQADATTICPPCTPPQMVQRTPPPRSSQRRSSVDHRSPVMSPPPRADLERVARTIWVAESPGCDELRRSTSEQLKPLFSGFGSVTNITINRFDDDDASQSGQTRGWALVTFKEESAAAQAVASERAPTLGGKPLEVAHAEADRVMHSSLAGTMASMQFGVAFGVRRGHCTQHAGCEAYLSAVTARNDKGGGPCTNCGCYPSLHVNLGKFPTSCNHPGCGCDEFYKDPSSARADSCGQCGHAESTHTSSSAAWQVQWQDIQLLEQIGSGRNGDIHRCILWDKVFAVKVLKMDRGGFAAADFLREITQLVELRHPHISELVAACCPQGLADTGQMAIVSEFAANGDLHSLLRRSERSKRRIARSQWLQFGVEIARGVNYLHTRSPPIFHSGLKPGNCLIDKHLLLRVSDFGGFGIDDSSTEMTLRYMPPEHVRAYAVAADGGMDLPTLAPSAATDAWSMGMILWELRATSPAWTHTKGSFEIAARILGAAAQRPLPLARGYKRTAGAFGTNSSSAATGSNGAQRLPPVMTLSAASSASGADQLDSADKEDDPQVDRVLCDLICQCWHPEPSERPSFQQIEHGLEAMVVRSEKTSDIKAAEKAKSVTRGDSPRGVVKLHKMSSRDMVLIGTSVDAEDAAGGSPSSGSNVAGQQQQHPPSSPAMHAGGADEPRLQGSSTPAGEQSGRHRRERFLSGVGSKKARMRRASLYVSTECREINVEKEVTVAECVGDGGFGKVFRGNWQGTPVAVKKLHRQDLSQEVLDAMRGEIGVMTRLHHPNIVMLMGMCTAPPWISVVTEFLGKPARTNGGGTSHIATVHQLLHSTATALTNRHIKSFALDVARGMSYLHNCLPPIIHRDLKTANLLLTRSLQVKIADFGTASTRTAITRQAKEDATGAPTKGMTNEEIMSKAQEEDDEDDEEEEDEQEQVATTMAYAAPEVMVGGKIGLPCDVFSFGVVLWELYTREKPWDGVHPIKVSYMVGTEEERLSIPTTLPQAVATGLIGDCWQTNPEARPSFPELLQRIDKAITIADLRVTDSSVVTTGTTPSVRRGSAQQQQPPQRAA